MKLFRECILSIINHHHSYQFEDGSFLSGHNGPYFDEETPARTTSHWMIANLYAWYITKSDIYFDVASRAHSYLVKLVLTDPQPITCRLSKRKDRFNGLMGQAWILEALAEYAHATRNDIDYQYAYNMYSKLHFCPERNTWFINSENSTPIFDRVFNHNLWFCSAAALLADKFSDIYSCVDSFVDKINTSLCLYPDNIVHHSSPVYLTSPLSNPIKVGARFIKNRLFARQLYLKSVGYHSFNLYAFSLLYSLNNSSWCHKLDFVKSLYLTTRSPEYRKNIVGNKYSFDYNPPGFELPFSEVILFPDESPKDLTYWFCSQLSCTLESFNEHQLVSRFDSTTLNSRIYQICRILPLIQDV